MSNIGSVACNLLFRYSSIDSFDIDSPTVYEVSYSCLVDRAKSTKKQKVAVDCFHAAAVILFLTEVPDEVEDEFLEYVKSIIEKPNSTYNLIASSKFLVHSPFWLKHFLPGYF